MPLVHDSTASPTGTLAGLRLPPRHFPEQIVAPWRRFSSGLWRVPEGDIAAAYCGDIFPKLKTFIEDGQLFANCGACYGRGLRVEADCYPLLPLESGPAEEPPYSYQGRIGTLGRTSWRMGPKVKFVSDEPTVDEWIGLFRSQYADGGYFANQANYSDFLSSLEPGTTQNEKEAIHRERNGPFAALSKNAIGLILDNPMHEVVKADHQLSLF